MVKYENSKVYKIEPKCEHEPNEIYIGSTTKKYLSQRMDNHRSNYKLYKENKRHFTTVYKLFDKYGLENCEILLLENVNAMNKDELRTRESHYIRTLECVNKRIEDRTKQEWYLDNKDKILEFHKIYNVNNKDKLKKYKNEWYNLNKDRILECNKKYREENKNKVDKIKKEYYFNNKEMINQTQKVKHICECGCEYTHSNKARHLKSSKHQEFARIN